MEKNDQQWFMKAGETYLSEEMREEWTAFVEENENCKDYVYEILKYVIPLHDQDEDAVRFIATCYYQDHLEGLNMATTYDFELVETIYQIARFARSGENFLEQILLLLGEEQPFTLAVFSAKQNIQNRNRIMEKGYTMQQAEKISGLALGHIRGKEFFDYLLFRDELGFLFGGREQGPFVIGKEFFRMVEDGIERVCLLFEIDPKEEKERLFASLRFGMKNPENGFHLVLEDEKCSYHKESTFDFVEEKWNADDAISLYEGVVDLWKSVSPVMLERALNSLYNYENFDQFIKKKGGEKAKAYLKEISAGKH